MTSWWSVIVPDIQVSVIPQSNLSIRKETVFHSSHALIVLFSDDEYSKSHNSILVSI